MGLEATYLLETPGACWALQAAPVWPGLRVLHYLEGGLLRISLPVGKWQSSGQVSPACRTPWALLGASALSINAAFLTPPAHPTPAKPVQARESPGVGVPTAGCLNMGGMAQPSSRPRHQRQMAWQAEGLEGAGTFHRRVLRNLDAT